MSGPLNKRIGPSEDIGSMSIPMAVDLSFATSAKSDDADILEKVLDLAIQDVIKRFERDGFKVFIRAGQVRPMSQEELLSLIPRKVHLSNGADGWLCETPRVSMKNVTREWTAVTCKSCLNRMGRQEPPQAGPG